MTSIGNELKDEFKKTNSWLSQNLEFLSEIDQFYRQRAIIEKEYATKLQALSNEYQKKKANKSTILTVGETPIITPGSLESASLVTWTQILNQTENIAKNHSNLSTTISVKTAEQISSLQSTTNMLQQRIEQFHDENLLKSKDEIFHQVEKSKKQYDESCQQMENARSKSQKNPGSSKYEKKMQEKEIEMNNFKNEYLIKINIANRIKDKFYYQDLPEVLDLLQSVNEFKTKQMNMIHLNQIKFESESNLRNNEFLDQIKTIILENDYTLDTQMFIKHNQTSWKEPQDFYYVPSSIWHDDEKFITSPNELAHLKVILKKARSTDSKYDDIINDEKLKLNELQNKRSESLQQNEFEGKFEVKSALSVLNLYLTSLSNFVRDENVKVSAQVEIESIENNAGDKDLSLDGLVITDKKKGFLSKLKGGKPQQQVVVVEDHSDDIQSVKSGASTAASNSHHHSFKLGGIFKQRDRCTSVSESVASSAASVSTASGSGEATVLYAYSAQGSDELSISPNESVKILQDDENGWTLVQNSATEQGLVPSTYIQRTAAKRKGPQVAPRRGAKKVNYCTAKYAYQSQGDDEISLAVGDKVQVLEEDDGSGWTKGDNGGAVGLFPTSYVEF